MYQLSCSKKFAGEEHAVWKNLPNLLRTACELLDRVNAESDIGPRGKTTVVAANDEVAQRFFRLFAFLLHFIGATEAFGVDYARARKTKLRKCPGNLRLTQSTAHTPPHYAAPPVGADHKYCGWLRTEITQ